MCRSETLLLNGAVVGGTVRCATMEVFREEFCLGALFHHFPVGFDPLFWFLSHRSFSFAVNTGAFSTQAGFTFTIGGKGWGSIFGVGGLPKKRLMMFGIYRR